MGKVGQEGRVEFEFLEVPEAESTGKVKAKIGQAAAWVEETLFENGFDGV